MTILQADQQANTKIITHVQLRFVLHVKYWIMKCLNVTLQRIQIV